MQISVRANLDDERASAKRELYEVVENNLSRSYQAQVYERKAELARRVLESPESGYEPPLLVAEAELKGVSLIDMAKIVLAKARADIDMMDQVELWRVEAVGRIKSAATSTEIAQAVEWFKMQIRNMD